MPGKGKYLIVIGGATAVGKTALAIRLAQHYQTEIISADSRQFYRQMDIGTAKPEAAELAAVPHHFINCKDVHELYGAGHFAKEAEIKIQTLFAQHDTVVVVGGSGLYLNALLEGVDEFEEVPIAVREALNAEYKEKGLAWLQETLKAADKKYYAKVDIQNPQRMIRALEIYRHSGKPYSEHLKDKKTEKPYEVVSIFADLPREQLYARINGRVDDMMRKGLLDEVKRLLPFKNENALKTVGYKELFAYLEGTCTLEEAVDKIKQHSRNYAKRQVTWFKNKTNFVRFDPEETTNIIAYIEDLKK